MMWTEVICDFPTSPPMFPTLHTNYESEPPQTETRYIFPVQPSLPITSIGLVQRTPDVRQLPPQLAWPQTTFLLQVCVSVRAKLPATGGSIFPLRSPAGNRCKSTPKPWRQAERTVHPKDYSYFPQKSQRDYTVPLCAKPTSEHKGATGPPQSPENEGKLDLCLSKSSWDVGTWQTLLGKGAPKSGCPTSPSPGLLESPPRYRTSTKHFIA